MKILHIVLSIFLSFNFLKASALTISKATVDIGDHTDSSFFKRLSQEIKTDKYKLVVTNLTKEPVKVFTIYGVKECWERHFDSGSISFELNYGQSAIINDSRFNPLKERSFINIEINDSPTFNLSNDQAILGPLVRYFVPAKYDDEEKKD